MNDNFWILPFVVVAFMILMLLMFGGGHIEHQRIYEKCLTNNSSMPYNEVTKMCKEFVK